MSTKISVLLHEDEASRFEAFCSDRGHKKSTLIVRLIKEHLDREHFPLQGSLLSPLALHAASNDNARPKNRLNFKNDSQQ